MKAQTQDLAAARRYYTENARQVQVDGVADTVAAGYVRERAKGFSYAVFYGKQSKPKMYFQASTEAQAVQRVTEALTVAGKSAERRAEERKQPRQAYHDSAPDNAGIITRSYTTAGTAQLIREALKTNFPGHKFSVTSSTFANGSSVDIEFTDGPSDKQVKQVYAQFISGHFDGSQDIYEYHANPTVVGANGELRRESYGAKYISTRRNYSPAYGFFLNALDLREQPTLAQQFTAFEYWHRAQRYNMQTSYGHSAGTWELSSNSSHGDLEKFAAALTAQGYAPQLIAAGDVLTLSVAGPDDREQQPRDEQPAPVAAATEAQAVPVLDQTEREFMAAELSWLNDPGQDRTDREFMEAELSWLATA